jgi:hypothetical protein
MARSWEPAFVAVSTLLGEPPEAIAAALSVASPAGELERSGVRSPRRPASRHARAEAIAAAVTNVIRALEAMGPS